ncbi:MAG: 3-isopropylmalate dehydratase [Caldilineaceae bacterium]|nr:3-isopropylmalate dehydratase [Caldilineaceae bacterium]
MQTIRGRAWVYGDNINTDVIFPGKYTYTVTERTEIAQHALEDLDPSFAANVRPGDVVVGGRNFGCGSSREQAATCLVYNGVGAVIAASFSRIFYRNALNNGLLAIACPAAVEAIQAGEEVTVDTGRHVIACAAGEFPFPPLSASVMGIVEAGGLVEYVKRKLATA